MEKSHFTHILGNKQTTAIHNVEEVSFELESTEAGCSKDDVDYDNRKRKSGEAGLFPMHFASTY